MDPSYVPEEKETKEVFGITFEQGRNNAVIDESLLENIPTENKTIPDAAKRDLLISLITLKYTQSNSVCYVKDGQAIGIGAGQQSRIHCTRLAGNKADVWYLRQCPKVMNLPFKEGIRRADRDNAIDVYISEYYDDVLRDGEWQKVFTEQPQPLTPEEIRAEAARLLQESDLPVAEIAHRVGYEDPSRFAAAFRRHTGRRPTELRRVACPTASSHTA